MASENSVMAVIRASRPTFRNHHDKVAFVIHASFLSAGFSLIAVGRRALDNNLPIEGEEVGIEGWNELDDAYGFVYSKSEKDTKKAILVKCLPLEDYLMVDVVELKSEQKEPFHLQILIKDYLADSGAQQTNYGDMYKNLRGLVKSLNTVILEQLEPKCKAVASASPSRSSRYCSKLKMSRREDNVYRRRGAPSERYADNQEEVTNRNMEGEELPHEVTVNTNTFTQMMTVMTQMLQESRSQLEVGVDKYLKLFLDMQPPLFKGNEGLIEAENWLHRTEKILDSISCPDERKVPFATLILDGEADRWWRGQRENRLGDIPNTLVKWEDFVKLFKEWFIPMSVRRQMQDKFIRLIQGDKSVMQYEAEFTTLSRYAPQLISTAEEKCYRFLYGLKDVIRQPLVPLEIEDYSVLVERARRVKIDLQITKKRRDQHKRKRVQEDIRSSQIE